MRPKLILASLALSLPLMAGFALGGPARAATPPIAPSAGPVVSPQADLVSAGRPAECYVYHRHHHHRHHHHRRHY